MKHGVYLLYMHHVDYTKPTYSTRTCRRCKGTGQYSWNPVNGSTCFGCNGSGVEQYEDGGRRPMTDEERAATDEYLAGIAARDRRAAERAARRAARNHTTEGSL